MLIKCNQQYNNVCACHWFVGGVQGFGDKSHWSARGLWKSSGL